MLSFRIRYNASLLGLVVVALGLVTASAQDAPRVLFLSKSAGFQHSAITEKDGQPNHVAKTLQALADAAGAELTATKDASLINAEDLKNYDLVIFYTTGYLTTEGTDGHPPMPETGVADLIDWIEAGGGFMGYHCATDTFHSSDDSPPSEYTKMIGASFLSHGKQFDGAVKVVDPDHPTAASIPADWSKLDEWYKFRNLAKDDIHVIALLDPGAEREKQEQYDVPAYPVIWCRQLGEGRIYYNAMGHREDVWDDPTFQQTVVDAATWALGEGPADAEPNYKEVVPAE